MAEYTDLINTLRDFWNDGTESIRNEAADAIEELQAAKCPHYIRNIHDRGDDSLCDKWGCEVKEIAPVRHGRWEKYKQMKNIPYYSPEVCDGHYCPMDCEDGHCPWADEAMEAMEEEEDLDEHTAVDD